MELEAEVRWMLWNNHVVPTVLDLSLLPDFVDGMW
jgi:hypothetical protein